MSSLQRVARLRAGLLSTVAVGAVLWGLFAVHLVAVVIAGLDVLTPLPLDLRQAARTLALLTGAVAAAIVVWRGRHAASLARVALFVEERVPALRFALATAIEFEGKAEALERFVRRVNPRGIVTGAARRGLVPPAAGLLVTGVLLGSLPRGLHQRVLHPGAGDAIARPLSGGARHRLALVSVRVTPPAYAGLPATTLDDPTAVTALAGSRLVIAGRGATVRPVDNLSAELAGQRLRPQQDGDIWAFALTMPTQPAALRLTDGPDERLLALDPEPDAAPSVYLESPRSDTVLAQPRGAVTLAARATDDLGLAGATFELMHTSGSGERFLTRRWTLGRPRLEAGARVTAFSVAIGLDSMRLQPGDVLHIRAIAWDRNDVSGPDTGTSDTRTIRVADARERDTLRLEIVRNLELDTTALSQRMLVLRAETLSLRQRRLSADSFASSARLLAGQQDDIRARVQSIVNDLMDVESPGVVSTAEISLLVQAVGAMADGERELRDASVRGALPHMRRALDLLMQARALAPRYYLRGSLPRVSVDIGRVRLKGTDAVSVAPRDTRAPIPDPRHALLARLDRMLGRLAGGEPGTADSLTLLRVEALTSARDAADPLGRAIDALKRGENPMPSLLLARRRLERATEARPSLGDWQESP